MKIKIWIFFLNPFNLYCRPELCPPQQVSPVLINDSDKNKSIDYVCPPAVPPWGAYSEFIIKGFTPAILFRNFNPSGMGAYGSEEFTMLIDFLNTVHIICMQTFCDLIPRVIPC